MQSISTLPGVTIYLTDKTDGTIDTPEILETVLHSHEIKFQSLTVPQHEHGTTIVPVPDARSGVVADGLRTSDAELILAHKVADCVPIVIFDPVHNALMTLHAGWRGLVQGIFAKGVLTMCAEYGSNVSDLLIYVGPCIGAASYVMDTPPLQSELPTWKQSIHVNNGIYSVDLVSFISQEAKSLGILDEHMTIDGRDTCAGESPFYSLTKYKKTKYPQENGRFALIAWMNRVE